MLRRSSLVECVSVLPGNRCLQNVEFFFLRQYVRIPIKCETKTKRNENESKAK